MRHYQLKITCALTAIILGVTGATLLFSAGMIARGILACIFAIVSIIVLLKIIRKPSEMLDSFATALEMGDTTSCFPETGIDRSFRKMSGTMNRVLALHRTNTMELETRKLYYDRILSVMTHEMRNSITPVIALSYDILRHPERYTGATLGEAIEVIHAQSEGIKKFLDSYHRLTHLPKPEKKQVEANRFFSEIKTAFDSRNRHSGIDPDIINFTVPLDQILDIDPDLMRQAVSNLIGNAVRAAREAENPLVDVTVSQTEGRPFIAITDNGPGISERIRDNLFQPFLSDNTGGTGIGLFLSRQIVRLHGGELSLASTGPKGTTFVIKL